MVKFTTEEKKFLTKYIKTQKRLRSLESSFIEIIEKYNIDGEGEYCGLLSNAEIDTVEQFERGINEFYEFL